MLNRFVGMGRFVRDPELRRTATGVAVTAFTIAIDRDRKREDGTREVDFVDCVAWRSTAEHISKYFSKGRMVSFEGRLGFRDWVDKDNNKRRNAEIVVDNIYFADSKPQEKASQPVFEEVEDDGEIPF